MVMDDQHLERQQCSPLPLELGSLKALSVLGRGAKGVAFLVKSNNNNNNKTSLLALKTLSKLSIKNKKQQQEREEKEEEEEDPLRRIWIERDVLNLFDHPLFPKLSGVVVTDEIVGFAIDYCPGGNLKSLQKRQSEKIFTNDIIRFYAAELVLALEYLHNLGVVYRDLKPENILIQENGHLMLVDFDLSTKLSRQVLPLTSNDGHCNEVCTKAISYPSNQPTRRRRGHWLSMFSCLSGLSSSERTTAPPDSDNSTSVSNKNSKSNSFVGTPEYVAPEIILGSGHDFAVDWWSLGVVLYEMLYGNTPFRGDNRKETFYRILTKSPEMIGEQTPLRDLIWKLLVKDPSKRISLEAIKAHEFFQGIINWELVLRISRPPFIPIPRLDECGEDDGVQDLEKGINMESFVQELFVADKLIQTSIDSEKIKKKKKKNTNKGNSKTVWLEGLHNPVMSSDFQIF